MGHQAASNAPLTSRLTITVHCFNLKLSSIKFLTLTIVPVWGVNPYWLLLNNSLEYMWISILPIINLSNSLPPMLIRLIGRYFDTSLHSPFPGLIIGIITECFHCLGKHPSFRHALYVCVVCVWCVWCVHACVWCVCMVCACVCASVWCVLECVSCVCVWYVLYAVCVWCVHAYVCVQVCGVYIWCVHACVCVIHAVCMCVVFFLLIFINKLVPLQSSNITC